MKNFTEANEKQFLLITTLVSAAIGLLYIWNGISEGFVLGTFIVIAFRFLYIPIVLIFRRKGFCIFLLIYGLTLTFIIAFYKTFLYNNFTGLLAIFIVILVLPKFKKISFIFYFIAVTVAFALNEENLCHYLIHIVRAFWAIYVFEYVLAERYAPRKLILYDDEIKILRELSKNKLQKSIELEGFSESTIYRRLKAATNRNHLSKSELIDRFKAEYPSDN